MNNQLNTSANNMNSNIYNGGMAATYAAAGGGSSGGSAGGPRLSGHAP